jgi:hypothetical protein
MGILYTHNREWILTQPYSGLVSYFLLRYLYIYYVVQKELRYFMPRLPQDLLCL